MDGWPTGYQWMITRMHLGSASNTFLLFVGHVGELFYFFYFSYFFIYIIICSLLCSLALLANCFIHVSIHLFIHLFIYPFIIYLLTYVSIRLFAHVLQTYSSIYFFIFFICRVHLLVHRARLRSWPTRFFSLLHLFIYLPMCLFVRLLLHLNAD